MKSNINSPIFSVVMPIYNVERYIREAVESVLNQSYPDFELICVNDGSKDSSIEILMEYKDERIKIIHQPNKGLSAARNTGINHSRGKYIALLDSDDYWHKDKLLRHLQHFNNNREIGISYCPSKFVDESSHYIGIGQMPKLKNITAVDVFCRNPIGNGSAAVLKKQVFSELSYEFERDGEKRTCYFDEKMRQSEDIDFWLRIALTSKWKFEGIAESMTYYRVNAGGLSANLEKQYIAWLYSVNKNKNLNFEFFEKWFSLASAYQKRYLARRAIQSRNSLTSLRLLFSAVYEDWRIILFEPSRTLISFGCAFLSLLPKKLYDALERFAMQSNLSREQKSFNKSFSIK